MTVNLPVLESITVPTQCTIPWNTMAGDDRMRFCTTCKHTVHNLSVMTRSQATAFFAENGTSACVLFYRRPDGTIVTSDCPENALTRNVRRGRRAIFALVSWLGFSLVAGCESRTMGKPVTPHREDLPAGKNQNQPAVNPPDDDNL